MSAPGSPPSRVMRLLIALLVTLRLRRRRAGDGRSQGAGPSYGDDPSPDVERAAGVGIESASNRGAERIMAALLVGAGVLGLAFCVVYALAGSDTQLLGLTLGLGFALVSGALIYGAQHVFPRETSVEPRPKLAEQREVVRRAVVDDVTDATAGVSRRRLLTAAAGAAGTGLGAAALVPVFSLGPNVGETIDTAPWKRGTPLVSEEGQPLLARDVDQGSFLTAFPPGADPRQLGSPVVVVRVDPSTLQLPRERAGWAPQGILAFSKVCTHAGCAVALYRSPLNEETSRPPALVCPCHYSTFDVRRAAKVEFGPAGRPLPQLPLAVRDDGTLIAMGGFSGPIGPAWWSVRREGPTHPRS